MHSKPFNRKVNYKTNNTSHQNPFGAQITINPSKSHQNQNFHKIHSQNTLHKIPCSCRPDEERDTYSNKEEEEREDI